MQTASPAGHAAGCPGAAFGSATVNTLKQTHSHCSSRSWFDLQNDKVFSFTYFFEPVSSPGHHQYQASLSTPGFGTQTDSPCESSSMIPCCCRHQSARPPERLWEMFSTPLCRSFSRITIGIYFTCCRSRLN